MAGEDKFEERWAAFKENVTQPLLDAMFDETPWSDSPMDPAPGTLAGSHGAQDGSDGSLQIVSRDPRGPIARYVILGTGPHPIDPTGPWPLHFLASDGTEVFTNHVEHPGTDPNPYNQRAWENVRDDVVAEFKQTVGKGLALAYLNPWRKRI